MQKIKKKVLTAKLKLCYTKHIKRKLDKIKKGRLVDYGKDKNWKLGRLGKVKSLLSHECRKYPKAGRRFDKSKP